MVISLASLVLTVAQTPCLVSLRAYSEVTGPTVELGEIADIDCPGEAQLPSLEVGKAANFGLTRLMDAEWLQMKGLAPWKDRLVFTSPGRTVQVATRCDTLSDAALQALLDSLFAGEPLLGDTRRSYQLIKKPASITLPLGNREIDLRFDGLKRRGRVPLQLRIGREAKWIRRIPLTAEVRLFATVAIARQKITKGETFTESALAEEVRDVTTFTPGLLPTKEDCLRNLAKASILPGRIITARLVDSPPLVQRGDRVPLTLTEGRVQVTLEAVARRDGRAGEVIPIWNPASKKMMHGEINPDGSLRLMADGGS